MSGWQPDRQPEKPWLGTPRVDPMNEEEVLDVVFVRCEACVRVSWCRESLVLHGLCRARSSGGGEFVD